jgi:hypothetical protein
MPNAVLSFFETHPIISLFLILGAGVVVGKIKIGNIDFGSVITLRFSFRVWRDLR